MISRRWMNVLLLVFLFFTTTTVVVVHSFSSPNNDSSSSFFSFSNYQHDRAVKTRESLDASRFHFQILFVDDDNARGRIASGLLGRIAEYNDAMCQLFPESCTLFPSFYQDAEPQEGVLAICDTLGLCPHQSHSDLGTCFDPAYHLHQYDLIVAMNDDVRDTILRYASDCDHVAAKCRLWTDFLPDSSLLQQEKNYNIETLVQTMLEDDLQDRVQLLLSSQTTATEKDSNTDNDDDDSIDSSIDKDWLISHYPIPTSLHEYHSTPRLTLSPSGSASLTNGWPLVEATLILATTGLVRFCLDTMQDQWNDALRELFECHYPIFSTFQTFDEVDDQLRRTSATVTGYFSPQEREERWKEYCAETKQIMQPPHEDTVPKP